MVVSSRQSFRGEYMQLRYLPYEEVQAYDSRVRPSKGIGGTMVLTREVLTG